jgi:hypothetical protein
MYIVVHWITKSNIDVVNNKVTMYAVGVVVVVVGEETTPLRLLLT